MAEELKIRLVLDDAELKRRRTREDEKRRPSRKERDEKDDEGSDVDREQRKASSAITSALSAAIPGVAAAGAVASLVTMVGPILSEALQRQGGELAATLSEFTPGGILARFNGTIDQYRDEAREIAEKAAKNIVDPAIDAIQSATAAMAAAFQTFSQGKQVAGAFAAMNSIPDLERSASIAAALFRVNNSRAKFGKDIEESLLRLGGRGVMDAISRITQTDMRSNAIAGVAR